MRTKIHSNPKTMDTYWVSDVNALLDIWNTNKITLTDFNNAFLGEGLQELKTKHPRALIIDESSIEGKLSPEIENQMTKELFPSLANNGVKYLITVPPRRQTVSKTPVKNLTTRTGPNGIQLLEVNNTEEAIEWLKEHN